MQSIDDLLADLTEAQRAAVTHVDGALLVLAGPGSGKTRVITRRTAHLIANGIPPWQILAVTFTNKAAGEMRDRIEALLSSGASGEGLMDPAIKGRSGPVVSTFHALCARLLRRYAAAAGVHPEFVIYDTADQREALKAAIIEADLSTDNFSPATVGSVISRAKNDLVDVATFEAQATDYRQRGFARAWSAYEAVMARSKALDFDDLLVRTAGMLLRDRTVREELQERFRYVLVDEYQDTNKAQFVIARAIAEGHGNLCVVGDPDQSIYGWRGADISNILQFETHFAAATIVPLGENFRSTANIVNASAALIGHNRRRKAKELIAIAEEGPPVRVVAGESELEEAQLVVASVRRWGAEGIPLREMAVLYRMNALSRVLEAALRDAGIAYVVARGTAFFDRREIRDSLAYLRLLSNPSDSVSLDRIVNVPARGLGAKSLKAIRDFAAVQRMPLLEALSEADRIAGVSAKAAGGAVAFATMMRRWRDDAARSGAVDGAALAELVSRVLDESGLRSHYEDPSRRDEEAGEDRLSNLSELVSAASQFVLRDDRTTAVRPIESLLDLVSAWLESVALVSDADAIDPERGAVTLMTLHAAKGLEFDAVAMVGLEQNVLPHSRAGDDERELEEERRLCYVGMTRARRHLQLSYARSRTIHGMSNRTMPSLFLEELPPEAPGRLERLDRTGRYRDGAAGFGGGYGAGAGGYGSGRGFGARDRLGGGGSTPGSLKRLSDHDGVDPIPEDDVWEADIASRDGGPGSGGAGAGRQSSGIVAGCMVRHPRFGLGRVRSISPRGTSSSAVVDFESSGTKTLILAYAGLVRVG